jgi:putative acetyltransferase
MATIRYEEQRDAVAVRRVNEQAFGRKAEADLVDALRRRKDITLISLVAVEEEDVVGHILFSPVKVASKEGDWEAMGLGPLAVKPERQRRGIGSELVEAGVVECRQLGYEAVVVLGHPDYYSRFGFVCSRQLGIEWEGDAPAEAFMVLELREGALANREGVVAYLPEFGAV